MCVFLPTPRKKILQPFEGGWKWPTYGKSVPLTHIWDHGKKLHCRRLGGKAQRQGEKSRQWSPAYRELTHPTALHTTSGHNRPGGTEHSLACLSAICSTSPANSPFAKGNPYYRLHFRYLSDKVESYEVIFALCKWNIERSGNRCESVPIFYNLTK